jgi:hypothetical protein
MAEWITSPMTTAITISTGLLLQQDEKDERPQHSEQVNSSTNEATVLRSLCC